MTDIASLVVAVDARQTDAAAESLAKLTAAGGRTEAATKSLAAAQAQNSAQTALYKGLLKDGAISQEQFNAATLRGKAGLNGLEAEYREATAALTKLKAEQAAVSNGMVNVGATTSNARQGMQQLGYQLGDIATMFSLGARPAQIFASQIGQVTQAVQLMGGGTSKLAAFLGGPWGIALSVGAIALSPLIGKLFDTEEAVKDVSLASSALSDIQSALGLVMDTTTGRALNQTDAMYGLARAQMEVVRATALKDQAEARTALASAGRGSREFSFFSALTVGSLPDQRNEEFGQRRSSAEEYIADFLGGDRTATQTINSLERLRDAGQMTESAFLGATAAVANFGVAGENLAVYERGRDALEGNSAAAASFAGTTNHAASETRAHTAAISDDERAIQAQTKSTADYIAGLQRELATLGLTGEALRQYEVAQQMASAGTALERDLIDDLNRRRLEAITIIERETEARETLLESQAKRNSTEQFVIDARKEAEREADELAKQRIKDNAYLFETLFTDGVSGVWVLFERQGIEAISTVFAEWQEAMRNGEGGGIGGLFSSLGDAFQANPIGFAAGAIQTAKTLFKDIKGLVGDITGLFSGAKYGTASLTGIGAASITAKGKGRADEAGGLGGSVQSALQEIAAALGVSVGGYNVSIGTYKDSFRVSGSGKTGKLKGGDVQDFGEDSAAAIAFAISDALKDGAILAGDSIRNLLGKGSDLQAQIDKAVTFKGVFDSLLEATDPVAYAMKGITAQFDSLRKIFDEAGASAAEYADLEKLIALRRDEAAEAARASKLDELTETFGLQIRMLELMGKSEEALTAARILEIAGMKAALQPLQAMVYELEDARGVIEKFGPLGDSLRTFREELLGQAGGGGFAGITARFRNTAGNAAIGDASALAAFQGDATAYLEAARQNAGSALEYQRALAEVLTGADKGIFAADTQVQMAQLQIDAIANQTNVIEQMRTEIREANVQIAGNSGALLRLFQRFEGEGMLVRTDADTPLDVVSS